MDTNSLKKDIYYRKTQPEPMTDVPVARCPDITSFHFSLDRVFGEEYEFPGEKHPFWELVYVVSGSLGVTAGEKIYILDGGQCLLHPPNEFHRLRSERGTEPHVLNLSFHSESMPAYQGRVFMPDAELREELLEIEAAANRYIYEDHAIDIQLHRGAELDAIDYRSKKPLEGDVRIVTFPGADCCACCGTHVMRSGQVGIVKFLSVQKFREGVRIELLCGGRAYRYLSACWAQDVAAAQALSVKPTAAAAAVERVLGELGALRQRCAKLEESVFAGVAARYAGCGDVLLFEDEMSGDSVRRLCDAVAETCGGRCAVFAGAGSAWKYAIGQRGGDLRALTKGLNAALSGRGGGKPEFVQGSVGAERSAIESFFAEK